MKKLMVLAAGLLQVPVIRKAREMGYYVIAADGNPEAVGLPLADKAIVANITDEEVMLRIAREEQIDGVIHPCSEVSMNVMGVSMEEMWWNGDSESFEKDEKGENGLEAYGLNGTSKGSEGTDRVREEAREEHI